MGAEGREGQCIGPCPRAPRQNITGPHEYFGIRFAFVLERAMGIETEIVRPGPVHSYAKICVFVVTENASID